MELGGTTWFVSKPDQVKFYAPAELAEACKAVFETQGVTLSEGMVNAGRGQPAVIGVKPLIDHDDVRLAVLHPIDLLPHTDPFQWRRLYECSGLTSMKNPERT